MSEPGVLLRAMDGVKHKKLADRVFHLLSRRDLSLSEITAELDSSTEQVIEALQVLEAERIVKQYPEKNSSPEEVVWGLPRFKFPLRLQWKFPFVTRQ